VPQGRLIPDHDGALLLSHAVDRLYQAAAAVVQEMTSGMTPTSKLPDFLRIEQAASPQGPWKPISEAGMRVYSFEVKKGDPSVATHAALSRLKRACAFPSALWNRLQAVNPGGDHDRYRCGDIIRQEDIELAASAERLLRIGRPRRARSNPSSPDVIGHGRGVVVSVDVVRAARRKEGHKTQTQNTDSPGAEGMFVFRLRGEMWELRYREEEALLRHTPRSGLLYIRELITDPQNSFFVADLIANVEKRKRDASLTSGDTVLDDDARAVYRERYADCQRQLERARRNNDEGGSEAAKHEMEELAAQVRQSTGLGSRDRRIGDEIRRAANRVSTAIERAIGRIEQHCPQLARHLGAFVERGTFLSYRPDLPIPWVC
jgi:hypothetical protein